MSEAADELNVIANLALEGLCTDGSHHKQWYLEQILIKLDPDGHRKLKEEYAFEEGIAP